MFEVEEATFNIIPILAMCGKSGSGKTYSALLFARGYVGSEGNICVIDTEKGRCRAYAGRPEIGSFKVIRMDAPFTPERYIEAYKVACAAVGENGFVIIDSASHEWEGEGGICDMADDEAEKLEARGKSASTNAWNKPKTRHKKFVNEFANPPVATILCLKIKTSLKPVPKGQPIEVTDIVAEKNFRYEMTTIFEIEPNTHRVSITKVPEPLKNITQDGFVMTAEIGKLYAERIRNGVPKLDTIDEIQVKIAGCETEEQLKSVCGEYRQQRHPLLKEIINMYNQQIAVWETMRKQEETGFHVEETQELTPKDGDN